MHNSAPANVLGKSRPCHRTPLPANEFLYGACYYPEHWDTETRRDDIRRMKKAGFNVVRLAEFAWDRMEPAPGQYDFSFFDERIADLGKAGIRVILGTPTAAPPRWMTAAHPEILRRDDRGAPLRHGSRQHASHAHPLFRSYCRAITRALAAHYRTNRHVIGWQTDNEFYCHYRDDHGPDVRAAFQHWLRARYKDSIAALNAAWGTAFWAQTYGSFEAVDTPAPDRPTYVNPSQQLDYFRFLSDVVTFFQRDQVQILRAANPHWFIFHNGIMPRIDYRGAFSDDLDFLGYDVYPFFSDGPADRAAAHAFNCDRVRSFRGNFMVPEHQCGPGGQNSYLHENPEPGETRKLAYVSIARGADALLFFRWRTCRFGAEMYWCGVLDHDNVPRRRYDEVTRLGRELRRVGKAILGTHVAFDAAVATGDFDAREAHLTYPMGLPSEQDIAEGIHREIRESGYSVGCVHPADALDGVRLYIVPHWVIFHKEWSDRLRQWVGDGGVLVIGSRTATRDMHNHVVAATPPAHLAEWTGAKVAEYGRQKADSGRVRSIQWDADLVDTAHWYEILEPADDAEIAAVWKGRHLDGSPAIVRRRVGKGCVYTVGTYLTPSVVRAALPRLAQDAALSRPWPDTPAGVEAVRRTDGKRSVWFFINQTEGSAHLPSTPKGTNLLTGRPHKGGVLTLKLHGVAVIAT